MAANHVGTDVMKKFFDKKSSEYDAKDASLKSILSRRNSDCIAERLVPDAHCLEFGCGTGLVTMNVHEKVKSIVAVDLSPDMLSKLVEKVAESGASNITPLCLELTHASQLPAAPFDIVFSVMTMHHISDVQATLNLLKSCLKQSGGKLIVTDLQKDVESELFHGPEARDHTCHHGFAPSHVREMLKVAGFREITVETAFGIEKPVEEHNNDLQLFHILVAVAYT